MYKKIKELPVTGKIIVPNREASEALQNELFKKGYDWFCQDNKQIRHTDKFAIVFEELDMSICYTDGFNKYDKHIDKFKFNKFFKPV